MNLDVAHIDKNDYITWKTIYEAIDVGYFFKVKLFTRAFINIYLKHQNKPQNIPTDTNKNILQ